LASAWVRSRCWGAPEEPDSLIAYLKELVNSGKRWEFAPPEPFEIESLSADAKDTDAKGKEYPLWDVDGAAVFARNPTAFLASLHACQARHSTAWEFPRDDKQQ
jgi:hypothetical protein